MYIPQTSFNKYLSLLHNYCKMSSNDNGEWEKEIYTIMRMNIYIPGDYN